MGEYLLQARGDQGAYERYLEGMDASMKQKVALTAAHLLTRGRVADMGMGSGTGSEALASLYPALEVVGVDVSPEMVEQARARYRLPNLSFILGDIARPCFEAESLDAIFDSSVLHHVTTFNGYDYAAAERALRVQTEQLRGNGTLIVRDFVAPPPGEVLLDLPEPTADLLLRFAREFRKLSPNPGFPFQEESAPRPGWRRFRLERRLAHELVLRKDYLEDWDTEVLEEYCYFTQTEFEEVFARLGLRVLASHPVVNPWIVRHRFDGKFELRDPQGDLQDDPPTNYVIVGEKVAADQGVAWREQESCPPVGFLFQESYRDKRTGKLRDLVRRPNLTVDVVPWFELEDELFVVARKSYPRPILACQRRGSPLVDGATPLAYVTEPIALIASDRPVAQTVDESLEELAGIPSASIRAFGAGSHYLPSPGGVQEEVRSLLIEVEPQLVQLTPAHGRGRIRAIEAGQLLRAAQVGGLSDARLELNVQTLMRRLGRSPGGWIGESLIVVEGGPVPATSWQELSQRGQRRVFQRASKPAGYLELTCSRFEEVRADGSVCQQLELDLVLPRRHSLSTVSTVPLRRDGESIYVGLDDDDLPAAQAFTGHSQLVVNPAFRLPREVGGRRALEAFIRQRLQEQYGLETGELFELGGRYHPSPGLTPEVVYPFAVQARNAGKLYWVLIDDLFANLESLLDGHLRIATGRLWLALGRKGA